MQPVCLLDNAVARLTSSAHAFHARRTTSGPSLPTPLGRAHQHTQLSIHPVQPPPVVFGFLITSMILRTCCRARAA